MTSESLLEKITRISLARGVFFPTAEAYNPMGGFYDWGPVGTRLRQRVSELWRRRFIREPNMYEISGKTVLPFDVLQSSGHVEKFVDASVVCTKCKNDFRPDHLLEEALNISFEGKSANELTKNLREHKIKCPSCGKEAWDDVDVVNTMFSLSVGSASTASSTGRAFLRPETAQNIFLSFPRVFRGSQVAEDKKPTTTLVKPRCI